MAEEGGQGRKQMLCDNHIQGGPSLFWGGSCTQVSAICNYQDNNIGIPTSVPRKRKQTSTYYYLVSLEKNDVLLRTMSASDVVQPVCVCQDHQLLGRGNRTQSHTACLLLSPLRSTCSHPSPLLKPAALGPRTSYQVRGTTCLPFVSNSLLEDRRSARPGEEMSLLNTSVGSIFKAKTN